MKFLAILLFATWSSVVAGEEITQILAAIPSCAVSTRVSENTTISDWIFQQPCTLPIILSLHYNISTIESLAKSICPDIVTQRKISACTQTNCNYTEQVSKLKLTMVCLIKLIIKAVVELSSAICSGYPVASRSEEMQRTAIALLIVTSLFVILRLYSRFSVLRSLWWDDWVIIVAGVRISCHIISFPCAS
jgi:hypothetical protein